MPCTVEKRDLLWSDGQNDGLMPECLERSTSSDATVTHAFLIHFAVLALPDRDSAALQAGDRCRLQLVLIAAARHDHHTNQQTDHHHIPRRGWRHGGKKQKPN